MTNPHGRHSDCEAERQRLLDLLAERALQGLTLVEAAELQRLQALHPDLVDQSLERVAAALDLALGPQQFDPLPAPLASKLHEAAAEWSEARGESGRTLRSRDSGPSTIRARVASEPLSARAKAKRVSDSPPRSRWLSRLGWLAAAACLLLAVLAWWPRQPESNSPALAARRLRADLIRNAPDVVQVNWKPTGDLHGPDASGDVIWSTKLQQGVMRIRGVTINDPSKFQYQLWIFDKTRDERHPVDGGVFDIGPLPAPVPAPAPGSSAGSMATAPGDSGSAESESVDSKCLENAIASVRKGAEFTTEVFVIIAPKLQVRDAAAFAVTVEAPGGVTVSDREHVVVLAEMADAKPPPQSSRAPIRLEQPQLGYCDPPGPAKPGDP